MGYNTAMTSALPQSSKRRGFTLIELLVSISIFVIMTALLVAKYSAFNNSVLLTNLAYDIALTLRTAQTYGLSVQGYNNAYQYPYGVAICTLSNCPDPTGAGLTFDNKRIIMFADASPSDSGGAFDNSDYKISAYNIKRGATIYQICFITGSGGTNCTTVKRVDITFIRPNPDAVICLSASKDPNPCVSATHSDYVKIIVRAPDATTRSVVIRKTGQISVEN